MSESNTIVSPETQRLMRLASLLSVIVASVLILVKAVAWAFSDSLSLLASLFDSFFDLLASVINFMAIRYALMPPDDDHRFGHGKAEDIAALAQATFIAGSGVIICIEGIKRLFLPEPIENSGIAIGVMVFSMALTIALVMFQRHVVTQTKSIVVKSDSLHYFTDILTNGAVLFALFLVSYAGWQMADPIFALLISAYIFYGAFQIGHVAFHNLMDREFSDEEREQILSISKENPRVSDVHDLKTRRSGIYSFIQFHMVFDEQISLKDSHAIADEAEDKIKALFPHSEVLIHQDPNYHK
jgi:ferrous-iron efflux pump FieF